MSTTASPANSITAQPALGQQIQHNGKEYTTIKEGRAYILIPAGASTVPQTTPNGDNQPQSVFYNPIQQFNRDLSVLAIKAYGEEALERKKAAAEKSQRWPAKRGLKRKRRENGENVKSTPEEPANDQTGGEVDKVGKVASTEFVAEVDTNSAEHQIQSEIASTEQEYVQMDGTAKGSRPEGTHEEGKQGAATDKGPDAATQRRIPFTILDALSATGLRALRYAQEIPFTTSITANDLLPAATETINMNVQHNKLTDKITSITGNALSHMYGLIGEQSMNKGRLKPSKKYDVIDLDPYGTAAPFLDAAVQSVRDDGGLLCVTCTDAGVWASNSYPEKAYSLYGGLPMKGLHSHEGGLRLILHAIATSAARYGLAMEPLLSLSIDFYARVFVRIHKSAADVKFLAGKTMIVYTCDSGCGAWTTQLLARNKLSQNKNGSGTFYKHVFAMAPTQGELCTHCGTKTHLAGPVYAGPLHSPDFIQRILNDLPNVSKETYATTTRIEGMLTLALEESLPPLDPPMMSPTKASSKPNFKSSLTEPTSISTSSSLPKKAHDPAAIDHYPFFIIPSALAKVIHCITPHENALRGALRHLGYRVTRSHTKAGSIKTDAPWGVIWRVMREWARQKAPIREGAVRPGTAGWRILGLGGEEGGERGEGERKDRGKGYGEKEDGEDGEGREELEVVFDEELGRERDAKKLVRYQLNPRENWGPMNRASGRKS